MALSPHPRKFTLHVTSVDVDLGSEFTKTGGMDELEIVFHGKLTPKVKNRIINAVDDANWTIKEHKLV